MSDNRPLGIFDSGLGGLTVVNAIKQKIPNENIVYVGDTARVPYGNKSAPLIVKFSSQITQFLLEKDAKLIVVACNTASALAIPTLQNEFNIPIIGVITPGANSAAELTKNNNVGVIGTIATINSKAYQKELLKINPSINTISQACPLFVPLVEEGLLEGPIVSAIIAHYIKNLDLSRIDTLILGCTHYPLLKPAIKQHINKLMLIDSADSIAKAAYLILKNNHLINDNTEQGQQDFYVTDSPSNFANIARRFLRNPIQNVKTAPIS